MKKGKFKKQRNKLNKGKQKGKVDFLNGKQIKNIIIEERKHIIKEGVVVKYLLRSLLM